MKTLIRNTRKEDFVGIVTLLRQLWPGKKLNRKKLLIMLELMTTSEAYELLCVELGSRLVGFASLGILPNLWVEGPILYVATMIVDETHRRAGIGRQLMRRISEIARQKGCTKIELDSAFHRAEAHAFYEKMGFEKRAYFFSKDV